MLMPRSLLIPLIFSLFLLVVGNSAAAASRSLSAEEGRKLLASDRQVFLLDVRTPEEYWQVRLAGARLIPVDQVAKRLAEIPANRPVLVYCAVGSRSSQAVKYLAGQGYSVFNLSGGIWGWQLRGFPVLKGTP